MPYLRARSATETRCDRSKVLDDRAAASDFRQLAFLLTQRARPAGSGLRHTPSRDQSDEHSPPRRSSCRTGTIGSCRDGGRCPARASHLFFEHRANEVDAPSRRFIFVTREHVGRAGVRAKSIMHAGLQDSVGFGDLRVEQLDSGEVGQHDALPCWGSPRSKIIGKSGEIIGEHLLGEPARVLIKIFSIRACAHGGIEMGQ